MAYATAKDIGADTIPVIDVAALRDGGDAGLAAVADELRRAAETVGFFYVANHGVDRAVIEETRAVADRFFHAPEADKATVAISPRHRGWLRVGEARMRDSRKPDLKESFVFGLDVAADDPDVTAGDRLLAPNRWPGFLPEMRPVLNRFFAEMQACGERLLRAFAASLEIAPDYFVRRVARPVSRGSLIWYPPQPADSGEDQFGVGPHTDYGTLTLLGQDSVGGLQVRGRDGEWVKAHPVEDTFVVNVGDLLARWTNDRFASTPHRVVNASGRERLSVAMFVDPDWDAVVEPVVRPGEAPRHPTVRCADYVNARYDEAFRYRRKAG